MNCDVVLARMFSTRSTRSRLRPASSNSAYPAAPTEYSPFPFKRFGQRPVLQPVLMKLKELPDGGSHDNDSTKNCGEEAGPIGIFNHPQINDRDGGASEKRGDLRSVETTLVPRGFFVMPFSLWLKSAFYVFKWSIHENLMGLILPVSRGNSMPSIMGFLVG